MMFQIYLFGLKGIPSIAVRFIALLTLLIAIITSKYRETYYNKQLKLFFFFCFINMVWSSIHREQSPIEYIIGYEFTSILGILVLFAIPAFKLPINIIEKCLLSIGLFGIILYLIQYIFHIPITINQEFINNEGMDMRIRINGQCLFFLLYFRALTKLTEKKSIQYAVILLLSLLCIIILGFRSQLLALAFVSLIFIWRQKKIDIKMILSLFLLVGILFVLYQTDIAQHKINQMIERNEKGNFENDDYVRYLSYEYYTKQYPKGIGDKILGGGLPNANSNYGKKIQALKEHHIIWADWGLIGLSWVLGIPAVLCLVWLFIYAFLTPVEPDKSYLCYWCLFIVLASVLTREIYRPGAFPIEAVVLYLIAQYRTGNIKNINKNIFKR